MSGSDVYETVDMFVVAVYSSEPYYQATTDTRLGEENKGHQLLTKMGQWVASTVKHCLHYDTRTTWWVSESTVQLNTLHVRRDGSVSRQYS